jgi:hypothetical protein
MTWSPSTLIEPLLTLKHRISLSSIRLQHPFAERNHPTYLTFFFSQKYTFEKCYGSILLLILGRNVICVVDTAQRNRNIWGDVKSNMFLYGL